MPLKLNHSERKKERMEKRQKIGFGSFEWRICWSWFWFNATFCRWYGFACGSIKTKWKHEQQHQQKYTRIYWADDVNMKGIMIYEYWIHHNGQMMVRKSFSFHVSIIRLHNISQFPFKWTTAKSSFSFIRLNSFATCEHVYAIVFWKTGKLCLLWINSIVWEYELTFKLKSLVVFWNWFHRLIQV